jgi:hypothetical protein
MSFPRILGVIISLVLSYCALFYSLLCFGIYSFDSSIAHREAGVIISFIPFLVTFGIVVFCFYTDETPFLKALIRGGLAELCVCVLVFGQAFMLEWSWSHTLKPEPNIRLLAHGNESVLTSRLSRIRSSCTFMRMAQSPRGRHRMVGLTLTEFRMVAIILSARERFCALSQMKPGQAQN